MIRKPIAEARQQKATLLNILLTAIVCTLGVNLLSSYLSILLRDHMTILLVISIIFLVISGFLIKSLLLSHRTKVIRLQGALAFERRNGNIRKIEIVGYRFNYDFCKYLCAFLSENKAYARLFYESERHGLRRSDTFNPDALDYHTIINSVLEFTVLQELASHLNSYFVANEIDKSRITTFTREQLDPSILKNRVIDLITRDMREREAFMDDVEKPGEGVVYMAPGRDGTIYERLNIELPPNSSIHRDSIGHLVVSNKLFDLTIWPQFEGYRTVIHPLLIPSEDIEFQPLLVSLKLNIRMKTLVFICDESLKMYEWC